MSAGYSGSTLTPGADGAAADAEVAQIVGRLVDATHAACDRAGVARVNSWPRRIGIASCRCVRPVFTTSSNSVALGGQRAAQRLERRDERRRAASRQREANRRRDHVVRRLRHVDVIVRMHGRVLAALSAEDLVGAIGQHLVRVHVVRRARAGLIRIDDELIAVLARRAPRRPRRRWRRRAAASRRPVSLCVSAAAFLIHTCATTNGSSGTRPLIGKFCPARSVWTPYNASAGTSSGPRGSFSRRVSGMMRGF